MQHPRNESSEGIWWPVIGIGPLHTQKGNILLFQGDEGNFNTAPAGSEVYDHSAPNLIGTMRPALILKKLSDPTDEVSTPVEYIDDKEIKVGGKFQLVGDTYFNRSCAVCLKYQIDVMKEKAKHKDGTLSVSFKVRHKFASSHRGTGHHNHDWIRERYDSKNLDGSNGFGFMEIIDLY